MRKIIAAISMGIFLMSCSSVGIPNSLIKSSLSKKVDGKKEFYFLKGETKVNRVFVEDKKLNIEIELKLDNSEKPIVALIDTELKYYPPKLYATNTRIKSISNIVYEKVATEVFTRIVQTILFNKEILNVGETINPDKIKDIYVGDSNVVVEFK
ncbi:hypothetical protein HP397_01920 [Streptobacillus felis]|uniref:Lipoprotein n=1 Tax=Streptobacillus felis TaxID=1384509 RepID=A0A7Z0PF18_9FUSO|nr:hypothetical protein [Streptobacillus felis]NYV27586.1 hypothetical protein [Streptobacillus felis]